MSTKAVESDDRDCPAENSRPRQPEVDHLAHGEALPTTVCSTRRQPRKTNHNVFVD